MNEPLSQPAGLASSGAVDPLIDKLNPRQYEAVTTLSGPLLILAGAGSGKTRVITYRIANLVGSGVAPGAIIALTFTNKAASEMKSRALAILNRRWMETWVSTFHSACLRILRKNAGLINYPEKFTVYDAQDQRRLIKNCLKEIGVDEKEEPHRKIASMISSFKNKLKGPEDAQKELLFDRHRNFLECFHMYEIKLRQANAMDFDDLLGKTVALLQGNDELRKSFHRRFEHIMVDEFQDTNLAQYKLVRLLTGEKHNICVVGDDDQSIYQWRGADIGNFTKFERDFPNAKVVALEQNYRSTGAILQAAGAVVARNPGRKKKNLWTENSKGGKIILYTADNDMDEAQIVSSQIRELTRKEKIRLGDVAIFYRTNAQSRVLEDTLRRDGFPYQLYGGLKFYDRKEVKDLLAYFKSVINPEDAISFKRIVNTPPRGIGAVTIAKMERSATKEGVPLPVILDDIGAIDGLNSSAREKLERLREIMSQIRTCVSTMDASQALSDALEITGYRAWLMEDKNSESQSRLENLEELVNASAEFRERSGDATLRSFLDQSSLVADADMMDDGAVDTVKLMTIHVSKGLEFPVVFVTGLEENLFPHVMSRNEPGRLEEERRLLYVAMTRSRSWLYLSHARTRRIHGTFQTNMPSRFLSDLPDEILERRLSGSAPMPETLGAHRPAPHYPRTPPRSEENRSAKMPRAQAETQKTVGGFSVGMKVRHPQFQSGTISKIEGNGAKSKITVYFPRYGARKLVLKYAKLEISG